MSNNLVLKEFYLDNEILTPIQTNLITELRLNGPLTRKELVTHLKTPRTTVYDNLLKLQKRRVVEKFARNDGKRGRPLVFWKMVKY